MSHLHKMHPTHSRFTWCGALCVEGIAGVSDVVHLERQPKGVELCEQCAQMSKPIRLNEPADKAEAA